MDNAHIKSWGFLRETDEMAKKAGVDKDTGVGRTGLEDYLKAIFPEVSDWIHDKSIGSLNGIKSRKRPDYLSPSLKLIVEFDGIQHYGDPDHIERDALSTKAYEQAGYKVVRIPYFIQLSRAAIKELFGVDVGHDMFDESIPSLGPKGRNTPAYLCGAGIQRMADEFHRFPTQYETNINALKKAKPEEQSKVCWELLEKAYMAL